ncbi:MAG: ATP-binding protein [Actinomycetota bacterium]|nr:ATP-binding protein [Actinomycetota bacterium]
MLRAGRQVLVEDEHGEATRAPSLRLCHPPTVGSVATARRVVRAFLHPVLPEHLVRVAVLLTSELVTNAVVHATTPFRLDVVAHDGVVRVVVADGAAGVAEPARTVDAAEHGRGLQLVDALSSRWGTECLVDGKLVWFELVA